MCAFDLNDADAQGLDALAASQLRLALRFAERAEVTEDTDEACKLARTSERAARSYRQILLIKSKLGRDRDAAIRDAIANPMPPGPQEQARINKRRRDLYEAVERIAYETLDDEEDIAFGLQMAFDIVTDMGGEPGFADADLDEQVARVVAESGLVDTAPYEDAPGEERGEPEPAGPVESADSS